MRRTALTSWYISFSIYAPVVALIATGMLAWGFFHQQTGLKVIVRADVSVVDATTPPVGGTLAVTFDDQRVDFLRGYEVEIRNTSTEPLRADDFERPITLSSRVVPSS
jgi:hypothetical protein